MNKFKNIFKTCLNILIVYSLTIFVHIGFTKQTLADTITETALQTKDIIPIYWMIFVVGGFIAITLTYVSWRKYKAEKDKKKCKGKSVD